MDVDYVGTYALSLPNRFRGITRRHGVIVRGEAGYGEFCPFEDYTDEESVPWLRSALESAGVGWPAPVRQEIPVNCTIPVVDPQRAHAIAARSGCGTAKIKVADPRSSLIDDCERVAAVRDALGAEAKIRVDANMAWTVDEAVQAIRELDKAAGGLEYVEQPCREIAELAAVRRKVSVPIAADESIRRAEDPLKVAVAGAADIAVLKVAPLGGVRNAFRVAQACGLPCIVSSAVESSVGLAAGIALAATLPELSHACGLATLALLEGDVSTHSLVPHKGNLPVVAAAPEPDLLDEHRAEPEVEQWWRARYERVLATL